MRQEKHQAMTSFQKKIEVLLFFTTTLVAELRQSNRDETGPQNGGGRVTDRQSR